MAMKNRWMLMNFYKILLTKLQKYVTHGIFVGRNIQYRIAALICDTPAKAFVLGVKDILDIQVVRNV